MDRNDHQAGHRVFQRQIFWITFDLAREATQQLHSRRLDGVEHPFFGLADLGTVLSLIESSSGRIECLRRLSGRVAGLEETEAFISFRDGDMWHVAAVFPIR